MSDERKQIGGVLCYETDDGCFAHVLYGTAEEAREQADEIYSNFWYSNTKVYHYIFVENEFSYSITETDCSGRI